MYIFFCSVAVFNILEQDQKAGSSTHSTPHAFCPCLSSRYVQKSSGVFSQSFFTTMPFNAMWRLQSRTQSSSAHECTRKQWGTFSSLEQLGLTFNERVVVSRPRDQNVRLWAREGLWPRIDSRGLGLAHVLSTGYVSFRTSSGVWKGRPDPAFPHLSHENPAPCSLFHRFPDISSRFFSAKYIR